MDDWTRAWTKGIALALSATMRTPILADPKVARLLRDCLEDVVGREDLPLLAWCLVPDGLHVIGAQPSPVPWTLAIGRVKQAFSHRSRRMPWSPGRSCWRLEVKVRPLADRDLEAAIRALHDLPVRAGLVAGPHEWGFSSCHALEPAARRAVRT
jgi:REP element-mobilizing transposase RayT